MTIATMRDRPVLPLQVRGGAFLDGARDLLHPLGAGGPPQHPDGEADAVGHGQRGANEREENGVIVEPAHHKVGAGLGFPRGGCCIKVWPPQR